MIWRRRRTSGLRVSFLRDDCWPGSCLGGYGAGYRAIPGFSFGLYLGYRVFKCRVTFRDAAKIRSVGAFCLDLNICRVLVFVIHQFSFLLGMDGASFI